MKRSLYDFITPPDMPKEVSSTVYYFPHEKKFNLSIAPGAPAYREPPCMAVNYDKEGNLLFTRFIFSDGSYKDDK